MYSHFEEVVPKLPQLIAQYSAEASLGFEVRECAGQQEFLLVSFTALLETTSYFVTVTPSCSRAEDV